MKKQSVRNAVIIVGALGVLGLIGCGDSVTKASVAAGGVKEIAIKVAPGSSSPASVAGYEAVARATGFARYMPATTHAYMGIYDGKGFVDEIRKSALLKMAEDQLGGGLIPENPDFELNLEENPQLQMAAALLGEEIFVGVGGGAPGQVANLVAFNESYSRQSVKMAMKTLEATLAGEEEFGGMEALAPLLSGLLSDPKGGIGIVEKAQMPPVTFGFKVSDENLRGQLYDMAAQGIGAMLEGIGPDGEGFAEAVNVERQGSKFTGIKIKGEELVASIPPDMKEGMAQFMDAATVTRLMKMLESKNLVVAIGVHESYLVAFMGSSADDLQIAKSAAESLLSRPEAAFMKSFTGKRLVSVVTMSEELQESSKGVSILGGLRAIYIARSFLHQSERSVLHCPGSRLQRFLSLPAVPARCGFSIEEKLPAFLLFSPGQNVVLSVSERAEGDQHCDCDSLFHGRYSLIYWFRGHRTSPVLTEAFNCFGIPDYVLFCSARRSSSLSVNQSAFFRVLFT